MLWVHERCPQIALLGGTSVNRRLMLLLLHRLAARTGQVLLVPKPTTVFWLSLCDLQWFEKRLLSSHKGKVKETHSAGNKYQKLEIFFFPKEVTA